MAPFEHTMRAFVAALTLLLLGAVGVVMALGWWIARIGLRPLERLSVEARALTPNTLSQRLRLERLPVEVTIEFFEPLLDETGTTVAIEGELAARATMNIALFRRALSNLLQNAIEH